MNISIGNSGSNSKQATRQVLGVAASAALALTALAGFSGALDRETSASPATQSTASAVFRSYTAQPAVQVLLVDTEAQKRDLESDFAKDAVLLATMGERAGEQPVVAVKGSVFEQGLVAASGDVVASGREVRVTDMTLPAKGVAPVVVQQFGTAADAENSARGLQADILASVVSTEQATFLTVERVQLQFANEADAEQAGNVLARESAFPVVSHEADIMASVVSTERAAYGSVQATQPMFGTAADAEHAAQSLR
jgi:hypothetical protein